MCTDAKKQYPSRLGEVKGGKKVWVNFICEVLKFMVPQT